MHAQNHFRTFLALSSLAWLPGAVSAWAQTNVSGDLTAALSTTTATDMVDVIVQFREIPTAANHRRIAARGGELRQSLHLIRGSHYRMPKDALTELAHDPDVVYISPDRPIHGQLDSAEPAINANIAYSNGYTGNGVTVAVIDSGVASGADVWGSRIIENRLSAGI